MTRLIHRARKEGVPVPDTVRQHGVVSYHDPEKGFGKIDGAGVIDYFFHITACSGRFHQFTEGTPVTFGWEMTPKGPRALEVQLDTSPHPEDVDAADSRGNR